MPVDVRGEVTVHGWGEGGLLCTSADVHSDVQGVAVVHCMWCMHSDVHGGALVQCMWISLVTMLYTWTQTLMHAGTLHCVPWDHSLLDCRVKP